MGDPIGEKHKKHIPAIQEIKATKDVGDKSTQERDKKEKTKSKSYADRKQRAHTVDIKLGDRVVIKQTKSTIKPPWELKPYFIDQVHRTKLYLSEGGKSIRITQGFPLTTKFRLHTNTWTTQKLRMITMPKLC